MAVCAFYPFWPFFLSTNNRPLAFLVGSWGFRFACECVSQVAAKTSTAQVPSYSTILDLDRKVRDFPIPEIPLDGPIDRAKPSMVMTRFVLSHSREVSA